MFSLVKKIREQVTTLTHWRVFLLFSCEGCCTSFVGGPRNPLHLILIPNLFTGAGPPFKSPLNIYLSPFPTPHECLSKHFTAGYRYFNINLYKSLYVHGDGNISKNYLHSLYAWSCSRWPLGTISPRNIMHIAGKSHF